MSGTTGGLIGNTAIICGGYGVDICYGLTSEKTTFVTHMSVWRWFAASIVINDNILWVTGGESYNLQLSTEYIRMSGSMPGPDLPMALWGHAVVAINSSCDMIIGGAYGYGADIHALTFYYDHIGGGGAWINGPTLMQARRSHAAGIVTDEVTDEKFVVVTGGSYYPHYLDSTEILQDGNWLQGKINGTSWSQNTVTT